MTGGWESEPRLMPATQQGGVKEICQLRSADDGGLLASLRRFSLFDGSKTSRTWIETHEKSWQIRIFSHLKLPSHQFCSFEPHFGGRRGAWRGSRTIVTRPVFWASCWRPCLSTSTPPGMAASIFGQCINGIPSGTLTLFYRKCPSRNSGFTQL